MFNLRPPKPRYEEIWDVHIVLDYLRKLSPARSLPLKCLTLKVLMLIALVSGQRTQTLQKLRIDKMSIKADYINFHVEDLLKQSRPGNVGCVLHLAAYPEERRLCVIYLFVRVHQENS